LNQLHPPVEFCFLVNSLASRAHSGASMSHASIMSIIVLAAAFALATVSDGRRAWVPDMPDKLPLTEAEGDSCKKRTIDAMGLLGARLEMYHVVCGMQDSDWEMTSDGQFKVRDNTNICSQGCQDDEALQTGVEPPSQELVAQCSEGASKTLIDTMQMLFSRVLVLDKAWKDCGALFAPVEHDTRGIVFVVDVSASMLTVNRGTSRLHTLKEELIRSIENLNETTQGFTIIKFSDEWTTWSPKLQKASPEMKRSAKMWIHRMRAEGKTDIAVPLEQAVSIPKVDAVYLLSDGMPQGTGVCKKVECMPKSSVPIHTTLFMPGVLPDEKEGPQLLLTEIARASGGNFRNMQT